MISRLSTRCCGMSEEERSKAVEPRDDVRIRGTRWYRCRRRLAHCPANWILASVVVCTTSSSLTAQVTPLARSIERAAARAATTRPAAIKPQPAANSQSDWSRVKSLEAHDIVLSLRGAPSRTLRGSPSGKRVVVRGSVTQTGLAVLNLTDPSIPREAKGSLEYAASAHPEVFTQQTPGKVVRLSKWVRVEAGGVFLDDRRVVELDHVIERIERDEVAEISRVDRVAGQGAMWGLLAGAGIGAAIGSSGGADGVALGAGVFSCLGLVMGTVVGAANETATVVYRAP